MSTSPFKFLDSYALADHGTFFGRDRESGELFRQCFTSPILVVYGGSGTGKTSLVQCGLASLFLESDWLPILVRRSGDMLTSLTEAVEANTQTASTSTDLNERVANLYLDHFKPIYFIFDQFEELFIFGKQQESEAFFTAIHALLEAQRNVHVVFIVREEYLAELTRYEHIVPGLIENRYRVERMARSHAVEVVEKLCAANGIPCSEGFSTAMVDRLNSQGHGVELSYLQVYLDRCWRARRNDEPFSIALLERIGYVDDLLGAFLDEQVADTPEPERAEALLKTFVSDQGTKRQLTADEAHEWVNAIGTAMEPADVDRLLQVFVAKRLLKDRDERGRCELLHDALARQIFQRITRAEQELIEVRQFVQQAFGQFEKRGAKLTANDLTYLRPYRGQLHLKGELKSFVEDAFGEEERRAGRKKLRTRVLLAGLLVVCLIGGKLLLDTQKRLASERAVNESNRIAAMAMEALKEDPQTAYLLAEKAYTLHPGLEAERALIQIQFFLYPELARFRGNAFWHMPYSKVFFIMDLQGENISCNDLDGHEKWHKHIPGLAETGHTFLDTAGLVLLRGDRTSIMSFSGEVLQEIGPHVPYIIFNDNKQFVLITGSELIRVGSDGAPWVVQLDTAQEHGPLRSLGQIHALGAADQLMALAKDTVHFYKVFPDSVRRVRSIAVPGLLTDRFYMFHDAECAVLTEDQLVHFKWSVKAPVQELARIDLSSHGLRTSLGGTLITGFFEPIFKGKVNMLYDREQRRLQPLIGLGENDYGIGYSSADRRMVFSREDPFSGRIDVISSSFDGSDVHTYTSSISNWNVRYIKERGFRIYDRLGNGDRLKVAQISIQGDTLSSMELPLFSDPQLRSAQDLRFGANYQEPTYIGQPGALHSFADSDGGIHRVLLPAAGPSLVCPMMPRQDRALVVRSDSLVVLLDMLSIPPLPEGNNIWWQCSSGGSISGQRTRNDTLRAWTLDKDGVRGRYMVPLRGCLDTIRVEEFMGRRFNIWGSSWVFAAAVGGEVGSVKGYMLDLKAGHVVDTGSFAMPANFVQLSNGRGFIRIVKGRLDHLDTSMRCMRHFELPDKDDIRTQRSGNHIFVMDRIMEGKLGVFDLDSLRFTQVRVPVEEVGLNVLERVGKRSMVPNCTMHNRVLYLTVSLDDRHSVAVVIDSKGRVDKYEVKYADVSMVEDQDHTPLVKLSLRRSMSQNGLSAQVPVGARYLRYDLNLHAWMNADPPRVLDWGRRVQDQSVIERGGDAILDLRSEGRCILCEENLYAEHRAVGAFEAFPLSGKEVIRQVREEKKFGEFWKQIDVDALLKTVPQ